MNTNLPPEYKFKSITAKNSTPVEEWMISKLFWKTKEIMASDKGEVSFYYQRFHYRYQIYNPELFFKHKNTIVRIRFDPENKAKAHLFELETDQFLTVLNEKVAWTKDKPDVFFKHVGKVKKITNYILEQRKKDKSMAGLLLSDHKVIESKMNSDLIKKSLKAKLVHTI